MLNDVWQALPDPLKAVAVIYLVGLFTVISLSVSVIFWQFVYPPLGEKMKSLLFEDDGPGPRS